jgi:hypothetical protein
VILYHATTPKKAKLYRHTGHIIAPVRGFTTLQAALAWACKTGRTVILELPQLSDERLHKLPDHHNVFGEAWWHDGDVAEWRCVFSAEKDA